VPENFIRVPDTNGDDVTVNAANVTPPDRRFRSAWLYDASIDAVTLNVDAAKPILKAEVEAQVVPLIMSPADYTVSGTTYHLSADSTADLLDRSGLALEAKIRVDEGNTTGMTVVDDSGAVQTLSPANMLALQRAVRDRADTIKQARRDHVDAIDALSTVADVTGYDTTLTI
jgi:hypothetical protein